ncbi:MAG: hypothetical protein ABI833_05250 [Acidobacteriota bacterium]
MTESKTMTKDPICGMTVDAATAIHAERDGEHSISAAISASRNFSPRPPVPSRRANLEAVVHKGRSYIGKQQNMNNQTKFAIRSGLALALALAIWSPLQAQTAEPEQAKGMMAAPMMEKCQEMKAQKQKMKADIAAQDARLTEQLAEMNRAPEGKKLGLMAAVLTNMAEQRVAMDARKAKMEEAMMQHMMQHMQMGKESMSQCPMMTGMEGMKGMNKKAGDAPKEQK